MSMNPNDPFNSPHGSTAMGGPNQAAFPDVQPPQKSRTGKGCLIGCAIASVLVLFLCCGGGALLVRFGISTMGAEYQRQLARTPTVREHIGEIESMQWSFSGTVEEAQKGGDDGGQTPLVFDVNGSKGNGRIIVVQDPSGDGTAIQSATLITSDGTRIPIELNPQTTLQGRDLDAELKQIESDLNALSESRSDASDSPDGSDTDASDPSDAESDAPAP